MSAGLKMFKNMIELAAYERVEQMQVNICPADLQGVFVCLDKDIN